MKKNESVRKRLIQVTIELLEADDDNLTARNIAKKAGLSLGLIDYYFHSKDNLIDIAVQQIIDDVIHKVPTFVEENKNQNPLEKLEDVMKATLSYLNSHQKISTISILKDMKDPQDKDNTELTCKAMDPLLKDLIPDKEKRTLAGYFFASSLQSTFLRRDALRKNTGFDFSNEKDRNHYISNLVDIIVRGTNL